VGSATSRGVDGQLPLAPHARTPASGKQHQTRRIPRTGRDCKRTKYDESEEKGKKKENTQPRLETEEQQSPTPHAFLDPTLGSRIGPPAVSLTTPSKPWPSGMRQVKDIISLPKK